MGAHMHERTQATPANSSVSLVLHKTQLQVDQKPPPKSITLNLIEGKVGNSLEGTGTENSLLNKTPVLQTLRWKITKGDLMKLKASVRQRTL